MKELNEMSASELEKLSRRAAVMARDLYREEPSYALAIENGIVDESYDTAANGVVKSYSGTAHIVMADGSKWKAVGHKAGGNAWYAKDGSIEFIKES